MGGTLWPLALAAAAFVGTQVLLLSTPLRPGLVGPASERGFTALYVAVAFATLVWVVLAYRAAPAVPV